MGRNQLLQDLSGTQLQSPGDIVTYWVEYGSRTPSSPRDLATHWVGPSLQDLREWLGSSTQTQQSWDLMGWVGPTGGLWGLVVVGWIC